MQRLSVVGLGKLGSCTAAALAARGFNVVGVDVSERTVRLINEGKAPVEEPMLAETITANRDKLCATTSYADAVLSTDATFIIVQTPSDEDGGFSLDYVDAACREIGRALSTKPSYHLVVLTSTVLPGSTESRLVSTLESCSGKTCGSDFGLCYNPEFIALGNVIHDFLNPDMVLIGEFDERSGDELEAIYERVCENRPSIRRMNIVNAELTKLSINTFVTTKITFANMLAQVCDQLPGANADTVAQAMGEDHRIGHEYLKGGLSYGGPCFPRDNIAFAYIAGLVGADASLATAVHEYNIRHHRWLVDRVLALTEPGDTVGVVGLAYRTGTNVIEKSAGVYLISALLERGLRVVAFDKSGLVAARALFGNAIEHADRIDKCTSADTVVLLSTGDEVTELGPESFELRPHRRTRLVDCWRLANSSLASSLHIEYHALGAGAAEPTRTSSAYLAS